jgi:hypothetical protein
MISWKISHPKYILLLTATYLFVVLTHVFFIRRHSSFFTQPRCTYNSIFKRQPEGGVAIYSTCFKRLDKSTADVKQNLRIILANYAQVFILLFFVSPLLLFGKFARELHLLERLSWPNFACCLRI